LDQLRNIGNIPRSLAVPAGSFLFQREQPLPAPLAPIRPGDAPLRRLQGHTLDGMDASEPDGHIDGTEP
jgi:hypothetical protein